jgi:hypothetical protein
MTESENEENETGIEINEHLYFSIKETFEEELFKIFTKISNKYGTQYLFTFEDLVNFYKNKINLKFSYRKAPPKKKIIERILTDKERCCARIWANGYFNVKTKQYGDRCLRRKIKDSDYCRQHYYHLTHGRYDKSPSKIVKGFFIKENGIKASDSEDDDDDISSDNQEQEDEEDEDEQENEHDEKEIKNEHDDVD